MIVETHILKSAVLIPIGEVIRWSLVQLGDVYTRSRVPHAHQFIRLWIRQRLQQNAVDHAKNRGVCTNPKCNCQHPDGGEAGGPGKTPYDFMQAMGPVCQLETL